MNATACITGLFIYPIKSCAGIALTHAQLSATGLASGQVQDRRWMLVNAQGRFVTQREQGRLALVTPALQGMGLKVTAPGMPMLEIAGVAREQAVAVTVWNDQCQAFDEGDNVAQWFSGFLGQPVRLVRFDDAQPRISSREWTGELQALNQFSDGFPLLVISTASLDDLNDRLSAPLPMSRFRPNLVVAGLPAYGEDQVHEFQAGATRLRVVKPCTRCKITTIDQATGMSQGFEPLNTLRSYRRNVALKGVTFGQNLVIADGIGTQLQVGQPLAVSWRPE
ncbi:MAG: MOSC domain-containing protein [Steroidobacteraceae bacterium]